jgi:uncharacterized membrane protein YphA (DoxX/SURF4 family)
MNWFGALPSGTEGFEYHLLAIGLATTVVLNGSGAFSIDRLLLRNSRRDGTAIPTARVAPAARRVA